MLHHLSCLVLTRTRTRTRTSSRQDKARTRQGTIRQDKARSVEWTFESSWNNSFQSTWNMIHSINKLISSIKEQARSIEQSMFHKQSTEFDKTYMFSVKPRLLHWNNLDFTKYIETSHLFAISDGQSLIGYRVVYRGYKLQVLSNLVS